MAALKDIEYYKTRFFQKEKQTQKFSKLTEEHLVDIAKKVYRKQEIMETGYDNRKRQLSQKEILIYTLIYLSNPNIYADFPTYDERLAFLIMMVDPNLFTFKEFLKTNLQSIDSISNVKSSRERKKLLAIREEELNKYEKRVREQIGFYDVRFLKFEEMFFKRFYVEKELITEVDKDIEDKFLQLSVLLKSFDSISDERFDELVEKANLWLSMVPDKHRSKVATYSSTTQKKLIGLNNLSEQFAFFILILDRNLEMLKIYEEESKKSNIEKRIVEEFGYYSPSLITLEKKFYDRFMPYKDLSIWTKVK